MAAPVCQICLRSGFARTEKIDERLVNLYNLTLCDYYLVSNAAFSFCPICENLLKKYYNFRQKCRRAQYILRTQLGKKCIETLYELLPPDRIGFSVQNDKRGVYSFQHDNEPFIIVQPINQIVEYQVNDKLLETVENLELDINKTEIDETVNDEPIIVEDIKLKTVNDEPIIVEDIKFQTVNDEPIKVEDIKFQTVNDEPIIVEDIKLNTVNDEPIIVEDIQFSTVNDEPILVEDDTKPDYIVTVYQAISDSENSDCENDFDLAENHQSDSDKDILATKCLKAETQVAKPSVNGIIKADGSKNKQMSQIINKKVFKKKFKPENDLTKANKDIEGLKQKSRKKTTKSPENTSGTSTDKSLCIKQLKFLKKKASAIDKKPIDTSIKALQFKERVVNLIENGKLDLGDNVTLTKEKFLDMFEKCDISRLHTHGVLKTGIGEMAKMKKFLLYILHKFNPEYETVFDMQYLPTRDMKLAEYNARKDSKDYLSALFKCELCYSGFEKQWRLNNHIKWHEPSRAHVCDICSMRFLTRLSLKTHFRNSHYSVYRCKLCTVVTHDFKTMLNHFHQHKGVKYICDICFVEYRSKSCLNSHRASHASFSCPYCSRQFVLAERLKKHLKLKHQNETQSECNRMSCDTCGMSFESRAALVTHMRLLHNTDCKLYKCARCHIVLGSAEELRVHLADSGHVKSRHWGLERRRRGAVRRKLTKETYRTCPICQEQVVNKSAISLYKHHIASHPMEHYGASDTREGLCEYCGKTFIHLRTYYDHLNTHTGARPYACEQCGARFAMRRALLIHGVRHEPPRFKCKDCGKMFLTSSNLYLHTRIHIGDRRFKCDICSKGFLHANSLTVHIKGVHNQIRRAKRTKGKKKSTNNETNKH